MLLKMIVSYVVQWLCPHVRRVVSFAFSSQRDQTTKHRVERMRHPVSAVGKDQNPERGQQLATVPPSNDSVALSPCLVTLTDYFARFTLSARASQCLCIGESAEHGNPRHRVRACFHQDLSMV